MPARKIRVLVVSGSSGGHIFPAQAFIAALKESDGFAQPLLVLPRKNALVRQDCLCPVDYLSATSLKPGLNISFLAGIFNFAKSWVESFFLIAEFHPDVVVGFGSFVSIPVVILAWIFRIRILLHEQNVIPGRANRFLAYFSDKIAMSFPQTEAYLKNYCDKLILTGNPLRKDLTVIDKQQSRMHLGLGPDKFVLLVVGGSQGSQRVNRYFLDALAAVRNRGNLQVLHLCGNFDKDALVAGYKQLDVPAVVINFCNSMQYAYSVADLAISRAGATTISELIRFKIPSVLLPYPFAYEHQVANARVLQQKGAASIVLDSELGNGVLSEVLNEILSNSGKIDDMRKAFDAFFVYDGAKQVLDAVKSLCKN